MQMGHLLICGDFNLVPDVNIDSSSGTKRFASPLSKLFSENYLYDIYGDVTTQLKGTLRSIPHVTTHIPE